VQLTRPLGSPEVRVFSSLRGLRSRVRAADPPFPPREQPDDSALAGGIQADDAFITGNGIACRCRWALNYGPPTIQEDGREDWFFCKTDYVEHFFARHVPKRHFVLFTHNSDLPVGRQHLGHLSHRRLRMWFAANVELEHPKLRPIPTGIANARWPHGDTDALRRVQQASLPKTRLFDASFAVETNPPERRCCIEQTGLVPSPHRPFDVYLADLASSYFCISPRGNGIDTHRTWEALYVRTVPVLTANLVAEYHSDLPMVVLGDWSEFRSIDFTPELYERVWGDWSPDAIRLDRYVERIEWMLGS